MKFPTDGQGASSCEKTSVGLVVAAAVMSTTVH